MLTVLNVVAPVFAIVLTGYLAVRLKAYPASGVGGLISFVNNFATPVLLFRAMLAIDFSTALNASLITSFYFGAVVVFALGILVARKGFAQRPGQAVASGFAAMFTNTVLLGLPIIQRAYGADALQTIYTIIGLHAPMLLTLGMVTMELARRDGKSLGGALKKAAWRSLTNPLLIGIVLGLVGNLAGLRLIEAADAFTLMMSQAVLPAALFGLGGALNSYRVRESWPLALSLSLFKLMVHPAIAWVLLVPVLGIDPHVARYVVVLAGMPAGINVYVFATSYQRSEDVAASTILLTTILSILTVSFWLYLLGP